MTSQYLGSHFFLWVNRTNKSLTRKIMLLAHIIEKLLGKNDFAWFSISAIL